MANEYKLSYTADEINEKLGKIEQLSEEIGDLSYNDLKDKPFSEGDVYVFNDEVLTFEFSEEDGACLAFKETNDGLFPISNGSTVTVIFDGVTYNTVYYDLGGFGFAGNRLFIGEEDSGEPFVFFNTEEGFVLFDIKSTETTITHTVTIKASVLKKIDMKFIPDDVHINADWSVNDEFNSETGLRNYDYIKNKPFYIDFSSGVKLIDNEVFNFDGNGYPANWSLPIKVGKAYKLVGNNEEFMLISSAKTCQRGLNIKAGDENFKYIQEILTSDGIEKYSCRINSFSGDIAITVIEYDIVKLDEAYNGAKKTIYLIIPNSGNIIYTRLGEQLTVSQLKEDFNNSGSIVLMEVEFNSSYEYITTFYPVTCVNFKNATNEASVEIYRNNERKVFHALKD